MMKILYALLFIACSILLYNIFVSYSIRAELRAIDPQYTIGTQGADLRLYEFLDYNCPYCKKVHPHIQKILGEYNNLLYIPLPIANQNAPESLKKAALAYAAAKQNKFAEVQNDLFEHYRNIDREFVKSLSEKYNLDHEQLLKDFNSEDTKNLIQKNHELFLTLNIKATPTFILNERTSFTLNNAMPHDQLLKAILDKAN